MVDLVRSNLSTTYQSPTDWENLIATIALRIRQSLDLPIILQTTADGVQQLMGCDRVLLYQFAPDGHGQVAVEAISSSQWTLLNQVVCDICFETSGLKTYQEKQFNAIEDIAQAINISPCYINFLNQFQIKANLIIPVLNQSQLWGILIAHHCTEPRQWLPEEIRGLQQIAVHVGIAIHQASLLEQLQAAKADLEAQVKTRTLELTEANQQLLQSENRFLEISESSPSVIYIYVQRVDGSIYFEHISRAIEDILGISVKQILENAASILDRIHPDDLADYVAAVQLSQETLQPFYHEWRMIATSGEIKWVKGNSSPKHRPNGEIAWHGVLIDIDVRKRAELALREIEAQQQAIIEAIPDLMLRVSPDGYCLDFIAPNRVTTDLFVPIGQNLSELLPPNLLQIQLQAIEQAIATNELQVYNHQLLKFGKLAYEEVSVTRINDNEALVIVRDITERKQAEIALRESQIKLREAYEEQNALVSAITDVVLIRNNEGQCIKVIPTNHQKLLGTPEEVLSRSIYEELPQPAANIIAMAIRESLATKKIVSCDYSLEINGQETWFAANISPIDDNKVIQLARDITERKLAELALQHSEEVYRHLIENLHAGFVLHAIDTSILLCNSKACDLLGLTLDQMMGKTAIDPAWHFCREDGTVLPFAEYPVNQVLNTGLPLINYVLKINRSDRTQAWFLVNALPEFDINQRLQQIAITFIDISDRKQAEAQLKKVSKRLALSLKSGAIGCWDWDINQNIILWDDRMYELYGVKRQADSIVYDAWANGVHPDDRDYTETLLQQAVLGVAEYDVEFRIIYPDDQSIHFIKAYGVVVRDAQGYPQSMIGINFDISDRKQAELETKEIHDFLDSIIENIPNMLFVKDAKNLKFVRFNKAGEELLGYSREELIGKSDQDFFPPDEADFFINKDKEVLKNGKVINIPEEFIQTKDQGMRILHTKKIPIFGELGEPKYLLGISEDITERKQAELALQESESRFQKIALSSPEGIYILVRGLDGLFYFEYTSSAFQDIFGVPIEQILENFNIYKNLIHPDDLLSYQQAVTYSIEHLHPFEHIWRIITPIKKLKWVQARSRPECREDGTMAWYGVLLDITDQIEVEQRLTQIAHHIPGMIYQYRLRPDGSSHFPYASDGIRDIYQVSPEQVKVDASPAFTAIHPDDLEQVTKSIVESAANLTPWYCEYRVCHDERVIWVIGHATPQKELDGSIIWLGYISDISDRKQTEIELAKAKEVAEAATKSKSQFLANMSHEIRTPMNGVLGMAELLADTKLTVEQQDILQTIRDSGDVLLVVINDILDFSKIESGMLQLEEKSFILKDLLASICSLLNKQALAKDLVLQYVIESDVPEHFIGDSARLKQIFLNLVGNAIKFTKSGLIHIAIVSNGEQQNGQIELTIFIKDNGIGIARDRIDKLFQPFTQADTSISRKYGGTGLGLAISKSLVRLMGGTIWVESLGNIGGTPPENWTSETVTSTTQGSSFYFTLVLKAVVETKIIPQLNELGEYLHPEQDVNIHQAQLKILLAEDNLFNQKVAVMMLKRLGYAADIANNGLEVLEMLERQFYDLILMDMQMPEMDGVAATKIIRQSNKPQPWIIALTANALEEDRQICMDMGMNDFVAKPISIKELNRIFSEYRQIHNLL